MSWMRTCVVLCVLATSAACFGAASARPAPFPLLQAGTPAGSTASQAAPEDTPALKAARRAKRAFADGRFVAAWLEVGALEESTRTAWQQALVPLGPRVPAGWTAGDEAGRLSSWSTEGIHCVWYFTGSGRSALAVRFDLNTNAADPAAMLGTHTWLSEGLAQPRPNQEALRVKTRSALLERESSLAHLVLGMPLAQQGVLVLEGWEGTSLEQLVQVASGLDLDAIDAAAQRDVPALPDATAAFDVYLGTLRGGQHGRAYKARAALAEKLAALSNERLEPLLPRELPGWRSDRVERSGDRSSASVWITFRRGEDQELVVNLWPLAHPDDGGRRDALRDPAKLRPGEELIDFAGRKALWQRSDLPWLAGELFVHLDGDRFAIQVRGIRVGPVDWLQPLSRVLDLAGIEKAVAGLR